MSPANDNLPYSILPTFHSVRMALTRIAAELQNDRAALDARRKAWLVRWQQQGDNDAGCDLFNLGWHAFGRSSVARSCRALLWVASGPYMCTNRACVRLCCFCGLRMLDCIPLRCAVVDAEPPERTQRSYWWLSFSDNKRPKGSQFLGVVITDADDERTARGKTHILGINPGGQVLIVPTINPGAALCNRLLSRSELDAAFPGDIVDPRTLLS